MRLKSHKGQNLAEYAILLALVIGVFSVMQYLIKTKVQAGIRFCGDQIGNQTAGENLDPTKGELIGSANTDITDGTTSAISYLGGARRNIISQTTAKGAGSYSLYRVGFTEGNFSSGE